MDQKLLQDWTLAFYILENQQPCEKKRNELNGFLFKVKGEK
jgi:hypothetical protein